eukprot:SAG31_NODE_26247_length_445_cov_2.523121_1_plen_88_part_10
MCTTSSSTKCTQLFSAAGIDNVKVLKPQDQHSATMTAGKTTTEPTKTTTLAPDDTAATTLEPNEAATMTLEPEDAATTHTVADTNEPQ